MTNSFTEKLLQVYITLRSGTFDSGENTKVIKDLRVKARITKTGPPDFAKATIEIYGMLYKDMEQLTTLSFRPMYYARNSVSLYAGDSVNGLNLAFSGDITRATADFNSAPEVKFTLECATGYYGLLTVQSPTAVNGSQPVEKFIKSQATILGYSFKNNGVSAQIKNAVFTGSPLTQARQAASQVGAELLIDDDVMILNPSGDSIGSTVKLSKDSGLIGYPVISNNGIEAQLLYNSALRLGCLVEIDTIVPKASGLWRVIKLSHDLDTKANGKWHSSITAFYPSMSGAGGSVV